MTPRRRAASDTGGAPTKPHPFALLFPAVEGEAFAALVTGMRERGFLPQFPIDTYQGKVLEGWTRHRAAKKAGVEPIYRKFTGDDAAALAYVCVANVLRRHLTTEQKRALAAEVLKQNQKLSDNAVAGMVGLSDKTIATERKRLEATSEIPKSGTRIGKDGKERPAKQPRRAPPVKTVAKGKQPASAAAAQHTVLGNAKGNGVGNGHTDGFPEMPEYLRAPDRSRDLLANLDSPEVDEPLDALDGPEYPDGDDDVNDPVVQRAMTKYHLESSIMNLLKRAVTSPSKRENRVCLTLAEVQAIIIAIAKRVAKFVDEPSSRASAAAEERARVAEAQVVKLQTKFFEANAEVTALKAQLANGKAAS